MKKALSLLLISVLAFSLLSVTACALYEPGGAYCLAELAEEDYSGSTASAVIALAAGLAVIAGVTWAISKDIKRKKTTPEESLKGTIRDNAKPAVTAEPAQPKAPQSAGMYCRNCGRQMAPDAKFCIYCGTQKKQQ